MHKKEERVLLKLQCRCSAEISAYSGGYRLYIIYFWGQRVEEERKQKRCNKNTHSMYMYKKNGLYKG